MELLKKLEPHIKSCKSKKCDPVMEEILNLPCPVALDKNINELNRLIGKYKFKKALTVLESILQKLEGSAAGKE